MAVVYGSPRIVAISAIVCAGLKRNFLRIDEMLYKIIQSLNANSGVIQTVSTVAVAIATIVYAFLTYRMASIMSRDIALRFTPYASIGEDITMIMQKSLTDE